MGGIPKYVICGGMYGGSWCPAGSFTELSQTAPNFYFDSHLAFINGGYNNEMQDYKPWAGAYGMMDSQLHTYLTNHDDNQPHTFDLIEIDVKNPEGAQFYKQSIVFKATVKATPETVQSTDPQYSDLHMLYFEVAITSICRREYPTPYSAYTDTELSGGGQAGLNGHYYVDGTKELGGWFYELTTNLLIPIGTLTYQGKEYFGAGFYEEHERTDGYNEGWWCGIIAIDTDVLNDQFGLFDPDETDDPNEDPDPDDDEGEGGESGEGGGEGDHNKRQDPVPYPNDPPIGGAGAGFITLYRMSQANMVNFAKKMFEADIMKALKDFFADPLDMICGIMIVPFSPATSGSAKPVVHMISPLPDIEWDRFYPVITDQYQDIDCGSIDIGSFYDSCFSYNPYTRYLIWLPYIGYRDLDPDEVTGHTIHVKYKVDCMTGDCVAFIMTTSISMPGMIPVTQCIAQYSGNCGVRVAFGRQSFDSAIQASIQLATGLVGGAVRGAGSAISAFVAGQAGGGSNMESDTLAEGQMAQSAGAASSAISMPAVAAMKTHVIKSGVSGSNAGYISVQTPHVIMFVPRQSRPENYRHIKGYPANLAGPISDGFLGYLEIENIQLDGITATSPEKSEIAAILRGGVLYGNA